MLFNSFQFVIFFIIITIAYYFLNHRYRWFLLLIASCYFYMAFIPIYILILGVTILLDYFVGLTLETVPSHYRKPVLIISLIANIGILAFFKYYNFFIHNLTTLLDQFSISYDLQLVSIILPLGLSFHTFQAMSYTIEVYRKSVKAERHFGIYALYVMYYPQLVAGPIERPQNLLYQFHSKIKFKLDDIKDGLIQMAWGFFKKIVIADRLALLVDFVYNDETNQNGLSLIVATCFYSFQIYCDFSGYSDIGIGASKVMGIRLMKNFDNPYLSRSISEFWKRWHISLSTWFKDYLYIPLGGNRVPIKRFYFNLFLVFVISGLWHGASWTFIIWGALHGSYLIFALIKKRLYHNLGFKINLNLLIFKIIDVVVVFILVSFAWIFFRSFNISWALNIINEIIHTSTNDTLNMPFNWVEFYFCIFLISLLILIEKNITYLLFSSRYWFYLKFSVLILLVYLIGVFNENQFIYFQF
jgi:alginate O-acetyltransferase complex protein AlgI